jgi:hypothetical protein
MTLGGVPALAVDGREPVIVLITDFGVAPDMFRDLLKWLHTNGQAATVIDLLNSSPEVLSMKDAADILSLALRELGKPVILVGHGFGNVPVDEYARRPAATRTGDPRLTGVDLDAPPFVPLPLGVRIEHATATAIRSLHRPITWPLRRWVASRRLGLGFGPFPNQVTRYAGQLITLCDALRNSYQPERIPGTVWITVHSGDEKFGPDKAAVWNARTLGFRPPGYRPRVMRTIHGDHTASGPNATAELGSLLMQLARKAA